MATNERRRELRAGVRAGREEKRVMEYLIQYARNYNHEKESIILNEILARVNDTVNNSNDKVKSAELFNATEQSFVKQYPTADNRHDADDSRTMLELVTNLNKAVEFSRVRIQNVIDAYNNGDATLNDVIAVTHDFANDVKEAYELLPPIDDARHDTECVWHKSMIDRGI